MYKLSSNFLVILLVFYFIEYYISQNLSLFKILNWIILYCCILKSNSINSFENKIQLSIMKLALNGHNLHEIEKILITK